MEKLRCFLWVLVWAIGGTQVNGQAPVSIQVFHNTIELTYNGPFTAQDFLYWDLGDGTVIPQYSNGGHSYTQFAHAFPPIDSTYQAILVASDGNGPAQLDTLSIVIQCPVPQPQFTYTYRCDTVSFLDFTHSICDYDLLWDFGDGTTSTDDNPIHIYNPSSPNTSYVALTASKKSNPAITQTIFLPLEKGGAYTERDWPYRGNTPLPYKAVPFDWLWPAAYPGDTNGNKVEDKLQSSGSPQDVVVALNRWDRSEDSLRSYFGGWGNGVSYVGKYIAVVCLEAVSPSQLNALAQDSLVWMVFGDAKEAVLCLDTATYVHGMNDLPGNVGSTLQSNYGNQKAQGEGVLIGLLDIGIADERIPGFQRTKINPDRSYDIVSDTPGMPFTMNSHGLLMAQSMVGGWNRSDYAKGAAPCSKIADIKVVDENGQSSMSDIIRGLEWLIAQGDIKVACIPLDYPTHTDGHDPLSELVNVARNMDILCIVAGGNDSTRTIGAPGAAREALTVANLQNAPTGQAFSLVANPSNSQGLASNVDARKPDVGVLGSSTRMFGSYAPVAETAPFSGSSISAALAAGAVACIRSYRPRFRPDQIKQLLAMTATDIGVPGWDAQSGIGYLNAFHAVQVLDTGPKWTISFPKNPDESQWNETKLRVDSLGPIKAGEKVTLEVEVNNASPGTVSEVDLKLFGSRYGTHFEQWFLTHKTLPTLDTGTSLISLSFSAPVDLPRLCFRAELSHPLDTTDLDNTIRNNYSERTAATGEEVEICFQVTNPTGKANSVLIALHDSLPECWEVKFENGQESIVLNFEAGDPPQDICVSVQLDTACCDSISNQWPWMITESIPGQCGGCCLDSLQFSIVVTGIGCDNLNQQNGVEILLITQPYQIELTSSGFDHQPPFISLHPNPTRNRVHLQAQALPPGPVQLTLTSIQGVPIWKGESSADVFNAQGIQLDLSPLPAGMYHLRIEGENWFRVKKIIRL